MNGEGQRPPAANETAQASASDAPEPGNARYPQGGGGNGGNNGQQHGQPQQQPQQEGQGAGGRRRFRRNRRGGRGRRGKGGGHGQNQAPAPLDAQGRIVDVENDDTEDGPEEAASAPADGAQPAQAQEGQPAAPPPAEGAPAPQNLDGMPVQQQQQQPPQQRQQQRHQQQRHQQQQQQQQKEPAQPCEGVLDVDHRGNGRLRTAKYNFLPQPDDVDVPRHIIDRDRLRPGVMIAGQAVRRNGRLQLIKADTVEGLPPQEAAKRTAFQNLTVIDPDDRVMLETTGKELITRVIDIVSPVGLGQRMLIVSPPKAGKTIMLQKISHAITTNRPDVIQFVLLVDERPEEVTDFRRTVKADVFASSSDRPTDEHLHVAEMALERAKRLVEAGKDVVILLDSITRLSRAYNKEVESSGRTLSGGVDSRALERPKRLFGAARNAEEGGSLTIIATALIDTGSRMDEVIFEEFKGTGNSEINLDRQLAEKRIFPAINIQTSGTRKEEKLFSQHEYEKVKKLRGALFALKPIEAMERLLKSLAEYSSNAEFLEAI
ncbi:MAG TPA: transcription termination factor Rho [Myxococcales bacterium]|nr:transcription termination factor Rho [Myxococcales bacterium]